MRKGATKIGPTSQKRGWAAAKIHVGAGQTAGVNARDLVGALANEIGLDPTAIGRIEIADEHSTVEVPAEVVDAVVERLQKTKLRGKPVVFRRSR